MKDLYETSIRFERNGFYDYYIDELIKSIPYEPINTSNKRTIYYIRYKREMLVKIALFIHKKQPKLIEIASEFNLSIRTSCNWINRLKVSLHEPFVLIRHDDGKYEIKRNIYE